LESGEAGLNVPARDIHDKVTHRDMANAIRFLAIDGVEKAKSGHPGMPMGMADVATVLFTRFLKFDPTAPDWADRDRFVLSAGHGSMLLYALLHLTGYPEMTIDEIKAFRQWGSKTAGHPEYGITPGVETTTGPLGQGIANGVGMAIAEKLLAAEFNRPGLEIVDHRTYVFMGDGCMMEGVSHEACALAGTLGLGKLIAFYDDNGISIDSEKGHISNWYSDDVPKRFAAYGWQVISNVDGHDVDAVDRGTHQRHGHDTYNHSQSGEQRAHLVRQDLRKGDPDGLVELVANIGHLSDSIRPSRNRTMRRAWEAMSSSWVTTMMAAEYGQLRSTSATWPLSLMSMNRPRGR